MAYSDRYNELYEIYLLQPSPIQDRIADAYQRFREKNWSEDHSLEAAVEQNVTLPVATDAGALEYEEAMAAQELMDGNVQR